ncbi:hypothetical protein BDY17DRAFT_158060 [Neohortaea acidophila]|uniref:Uncharacterized protein n=1 Tax=Neohortaea acidophila TaxID=245834 RepID=A0A6A6PSW5_9PEZI|nr:uncharacterized protein BDY17DRAFT_158060 [Neohortaea acidophila]KAF2482317.1 hypothetical protein BDY17DRAFT_158060 [Neohortaea acidophila]
MLAARIAALFGMRWMRSGAGWGSPASTLHPPQTAGRAVAGLTPSLICLLNASSLTFPVFACSPSYSPSAAASLTTGPFLPCQ